MLVDVATVRHALEHDDLEPSFQPLVELHTGKLAGFEVLARWRGGLLAVGLKTSWQMAVAVIVGRNIKRDRS